MAFTTQDWSSDLKRLQSATQSLRTTTMTSPNSNQGAAFNKQVSNLSKGVDRLALRLDEMEESVANNGGSDFEGLEDSGQVVRWRVQVDALVRQVGGLQTLTNSSIGDGGNANSNASSRTVPSGDDQTQSAYMQTTKTVMEAQDDLLLSLGEGVGRLKTTAGLINEEATLHSKLLDDMDGDVEKAQSTLVAETRHAMKIRQESSVCRLYLVIMALVALMVMLLVLGMSG
jgi:hypothetical protein